jgi:fatty acid desaturase
MAEPRHPLRALYSDDADARRYVREGFLYVALIQAQLAAVLLGWLPPWSLPALAPVWMARLMIGRHELIHLRKEGEVDAFTRLWPVLAMVTPLSCGYREYRRLHQRHHQHLLTDGDPDVYQIRGSLLSGWFHCFTSPEQTLVRWIAEAGVDGALVRGVVARALFFAVGAALCGRLFLWYWVPLRLTYGTALFLFSYVLHRRGPRYGVFRIELGPVGVRLFVLLFGRVGWLAVCNHDVHHHNGNLSPLHLLEARRRLEANSA